MSCEVKNKIDKKLPAFEKEEKLALYSAYSLLFHAAGKTFDTCISSTAGQRAFFERNEVLDPHQTERLKRSTKNPRLRAKKRIREAVVAMELFSQSPSLLDKFDPWKALAHVRTPLKADEVAVAEAKTAAEAETAAETVALLIDLSNEPAEMEDNRNDGDENGSAAEMEDDCSDGDKNGDGEERNVGDSNNTSLDESHDESFLSEMSFSLNDPVSQNDTTDTVPALATASTAEPLFADMEDQEEELHATSVEELAMQLLGNAMDKKKDDNDSNSFEEKDGKVQIGGVWRNKAEKPTENLAQNPPRKVGLEAYLKTKPLDKIRAEEDRMRSRQKRALNCLMHSTYLSLVCWTILISDRFLWKNRSHGGVTTSTFARSQQP